MLKNINIVKSPNQPNNINVLWYKPGDGIYHFKDTWKKTTGTSPNLQPAYKITIITPSEVDDMVNG